MPNINLRDARNRDALVRADSVRQTATVRYVDKDGGPVQLRKVLKGTLANGLEALLAANGGDLDKIGAALLAGDPEIDVEQTGMFLVNPGQVYVNDENKIVYRIVQTEVVRAPDGTERERRPRRRVQSNVDSEIPLTWTGRKVKKTEALTRFVFSSKLRIIHINGLTYDFLYGIAKELAEADSLMLLGAGKSGKEPLVIRHGATPCRGFLEGRIDGDRYVLLLHLSKMELKRPPPVVVSEASATAAVAAAATVQSATPEPAPAPAATQPDLVHEAPGRKPTVQEVLAATAGATTSPDMARDTAKNGIRETVEAAKTSTRREKVATVADAASPPAPDATDATADAAPAKPARKRSPRTKPASDAPST